jgi:hypothetical protein
MAVRMLGELKDPRALPHLRKLEQSQEPFLAEYAARADAAIEGRPHQRPRPSRQQLDADVWLLPADCSLVGQLAPREAIPLDWAGLMGSLGPIAADRPREMLLAHFHERLLGVFHRMGNTRIDAVTVGLSGELEPQKGFVVVIARGRYNREALKSLLGEFNEGEPPIQHRGGIDVVTIADEMQVLLPSDEQFILLAGPALAALPTEKVLAAVRTGRGTLNQNRTFDELVRSVDRDSFLWGAMQVTNSYRAVEVFQPLQSVVWTASLKGNRLDVAAEARGADATGAEKAAAVLKQWRELALKEGQQAVEFLPPLKPAIDFLSSVEVRQEGAALTATGRVESASSLVLLPLVFVAVNSGNF